MADDYESASTVLIIAAALREDANRVGVAIGQDQSPLPGATYTVPLSESGEAPPTHWGAHLYSSSAFSGDEGMIALGKIGMLPPVDWEESGLTAERVQAVVLDVRMRVAVGATGVAATANINAALGEAGLQRIWDYEEP